MRFLIVSLLLLVSAASQAQKVYTLQECRQMATSHNKNVQVAQEKVKMASSMKKAAFTQYLPNISASGGYLWTDQQIQLLSEEQRNALGSMGTTAQSAVLSDQSNAWPDDRRARHDIELGRAEYGKCV